MNVQQAYNDWALTYDTDRNLTRDLDAEVVRNTLAGQHCHTILEVGCGTGKNTAFLAQIGRHVRALDFSAGMIAQARAKLQLDNVTFTVADITQRWPGEDGSVELVTCNLVLEHVQDLFNVFSEASRVLAKNGRLFVCELHPFRQYQGTKANFQRGHTKTEIPAFVHHLSDYTAAAENNRLVLASVKEWWHADDKDKPPRLVSFLFEKREA